PGTVRDALVSQVDITPTILDYLNIHYYDDFQGVSLRPVIEENETKVHDFVYSEAAVKDGRHFSKIVNLLACRDFLAVKFFRCI
ncbi:unnamed protein product, partial [marine sediment metagenome]